MSRKLCIDLFCGKTQNGGCQSSHVLSVWQTPVLATVTQEVDRLVLMGLFLSCCWLLVLKKAINNLADSEFTIVYKRFTLLRLGHRACMHNVRLVREAFGSPLPAISFLPLTFRRRKDCFLFFFEI